MSDTKFTPAPWAIEENDKRWTFSANLIAAVPDMYEALIVAEKILGYLVEEYPGYAKDLHQVRAAVAKARGESNE